MKTLLTAAAASAFVASASAVPVGITGITTTNGNAGSVTETGTNVTGFSSGGTTNSNLFTAVSAIASGNANFGLPITGTSGTADTTTGAITDLDVSNGFANVTQPGGAFLDFQFGVDFASTGAAGVGNDFILFDLGSTPGSAAAGDDGFRVQALDSAGALLGTFLQINPENFGDTGKDIRFSLDGTANASGASPRNIAGVGFDVTDFGVDASSNAVTGFRVFNDTTGFDILAVGANADAVPEPASAALVAAGLGLVSLRRRRA